MYIIQSEVDGTYYVGFTTDNNRRFTEHNQGKSPYTKAHRPYRLIYTEVYPSIKAAKVREKYAFDKALNKMFIGDFIKTSSVDGTTYTLLNTQEKVDSYNEGTYYDK